jgi:pimeloyl-ACP methyl ester carboxylesterase
MEHLAVLRDGLEVPYVEQGDRDGVPVVLLHAWLDSRRCFDQLMAALPEWIRAFAFDQRGHGDAARPANGYGIEDFAGDIGAFMEAVGLEATVLAGASSGGYVAQRFAVDNPARTLGLALLGSPRTLRGRRPPFASLLATLEDPIDASVVHELNDGMLGRQVPATVMATLCAENLKVPARIWRDAFEGRRTTAGQRPDPRANPDRLGRTRLAAPTCRPRGDGAGDPRRATRDLCRRRPPTGNRGPERVAADLTALCVAVAARHAEQ